MTIMLNDKQVITGMNSMMIIQVASVLLLGTSSHNQRRRMAFLQCVFYGALSVTASKDHRNLLVLNLF